MAFGTACVDAVSSGTLRNSEVHDRFAADAHLLVLLAKQTRATA